MIVYLYFMFWAIVFYAVVGAIKLIDKAIRDYQFKKNVEQRILRGKELSDKSDQFRRELEEGLRRALGDE